MKRALAAVARACVGLAALAILCPLAAAPWLSCACSRACKRALRAPVVVFP